MDPFSSAWWFDDWANDRWREGLGPAEMRTVAEPQTWQLREVWRRHNLLAIDEAPPAVAGQHYDLLETWSDSVRYRLRRPKRRARCWGMIKVGHEPEPWRPPQSSA